KRWGSRALNCAIAALTANRGRRVILYHDGLADRTAGVAAVVRSIPALGRGVGVPTCPGCGRSTQVVHRGATACVRGCGRGKGWASWTLIGAVSALSADRWRGVILDHDGLGDSTAGVPAVVCGIPALGRGVGVPTRPSGCRSTQVVHRGATAGVRGRRRGKGWASWTLNGRSGE